MNKFLILTSVMLMAFASQASYLYWQVSGSDISDITHSSDPTMHVNYATLWAVNGTDKVDVGWSNISLSSGEMMHIQASDLDTNFGDGYSYYVELSNYNGVNWDNRTVLAEGTKTSYSDLVTAGFIQTQLISIPTAWTGGTYSVPEPTSGMMILLGLAALALKRR